MNSNMETLDWPCPSSATLAREAAQLPKDVAAVLYSVAELADAAAAERYEVLLDEREHPAQSLLQHEFSEYQGPALCFIIPGEAPQDAGSERQFACWTGCSPMRDATGAGQLRTVGEVLLILVQAWSCRRRRSAGCSWCCFPSSFATGSARTGRGSPSATWSPTCCKS